MLNLENLNNEMFEKCLDELYKAAQPSITFDEFIKLSKENPDIPIYKHYYLSDNETKYIIDKYAELYRLNSNFKKHCELLINDIINGCHKDKYIKPEDGSPGYRGYEKVPPLKEVIGEEAADKVVEFIENRRDYYRFETKEENFKFHIYNIAPNSNKEEVIKYWESVNKPMEKIVDRDPEYNYERYYLGLSEEEIEEIKEYDE